MFFYRLYLTVWQPLRRTLQRDFALPLFTVGVACSFVKCLMAALAPQCATQRKLHRSTKAGKKNKKNEAALLRQPHPFERGYLLFLGVAVAELFDAACSVHEHALTRVEGVAGV